MCCQIASHIEEQLHEMWPNLLVRSDLRFWDHEWRRHGHGFEFENPNSYFELAIRCKRRLDRIIGGDLVEYLRQIGKHMKILIFAQLMHIIIAM